MEMEVDPNKTKAKTGDSVVRFLPSLPETRRKPDWQHTIFKGQTSTKKISGDLSDLCGSSDNRNHRSKNDCGELPNSVKGGKRVNPANSAKATMKYPKRDREAFRQALVGIIMQNEDTMSPPQFPSVTDKSHRYVFIIYLKTLI